MMPGRVTIARGNVAVRIRDHGRPATVCLLADIHRQRQARQQRGREFCAMRSPPPLPNTGLSTPAIRAAEAAHVLDHAQHGDVHLGEHLDAFAGVEQGNVLRGGHDHRAGYRHLLRQRQLNVAGSRRHVDNEVIEIVPGRLRSSCCSAPDAMGPRQTIGVFSETMKLIDMV